MTPVATPTPAPTNVATVPDGLLVFEGKLVICSDIPYPPLEFFDDQGNPTGSDIDIGTEIAKRLGLTVQIENSVFDTIIDAVTGGKCDIIISAQNITADTNTLTARTIRARRACGRRPRPTGSPPST